jgi:peptidoglycan/xylan/chitin deacetylase (PgdA/CDA1 family)
MKRLCFTVDVDRDVNECVPGKREAVTHNSDSIRYTSSALGTGLILDMLDDIGIRGTFFAEATTLGYIDADLGNNEVAMHGLDHEDLTGELSGIKFSETELSGIMRVSFNVIKDLTGKAPKGFRAPYMRTDNRIMKALSTLGLEYDSSVYAPVCRTFFPYEVAAGIKEIPVPTGIDRNGKKISAFLWPMHEGTRGPNDFIELANKMEEGVFVLATHSWHIAESREKGVMNKAEREKNLANVKQIITTLLDNGSKAVRMIDAVNP